ncbi:fimbrial protein [Escherichia coli]|nr:fimbrial protein [Escherichia coli]
MDAQIVRGEKTVVINVDKAIPFLGIRTIDKTAFKGQAGIALQISYGDALKIDAFNEGYAPLILEVKDANGVKIGTMETRILVAAMASVKLEDEAAEEESLYATASGQGFFGGIGQRADAVATSPAAVSSIVFPEASDHYDNQGASTLVEPESNDFSDTISTYSGFYASGIPRSQPIYITLDQAASGDAPIQWKASLCTDPKNELRPRSWTTYAA